MEFENAEFGKRDVCYHDYQRSPFKLFSAIYWSEICVDTYVTWYHVTSQNSSQENQIPTRLQTLLQCVILNRPIRVQYEYCIMRYIKLKWVFETSYMYYVNQIELR